MPMGDRVRGTCFHAVAAEDASVVVDVVDGGIPLASGDADLFGVLGGFDVDTIGRAGRGAEEAGDALFQAVFVALQNVTAAEPFLEPRRSIRVVLGNRRLEHLLESDAHALGDRSSRT